MRGSNGWRETTLGTFAHAVSERNGGRDCFPVLSVTKYDGFVPSNEYFSKTVHSKDTENYKVVRQGQFAYATIHLDEGSVDYLTGFEAGIISPMYTVFEVDEEQVDHRFLLSLLKLSARLGKFDALGNGGVNRRKSISFKTLSGFTINLPPLPEQRRIAEILSSVDEAIAATQAVIEQTRTVKQGVLKRLLTKGIGHTRFKQTEIGEIPEAWTAAKLDELTACVTSGSRGWARHYSDSGSLFVRSQNIRDGAFDFSDRQHVNVTSGAEGTRTKLCNDDIVLTITGNSVGNIARVYELGDAYISQHAALVRLQNPSISRYIEAFFCSAGPGHEQILQAQYGQSKPGLNLDNVRNLIVALPPAEERSKLMEAATEFSQAEQTGREQLQSLMATKTALMADLLTGRKRVPLTNLAAAE